MPIPKGPIAPPVELDLDLEGEEDDESTQAAPLDFVPGDAPLPTQGGGISLDEDDDEERTTIDKRPGPPRQAVGIYI